MAATNAIAPSNKPELVVEQNLALLGNVMRYLLEQPHVFSALPDSFELVILPDDNPTLRLYNLELLDAYGSDGKQVVFARVASTDANFAITPPSLYIPLTATTP